MDLEVLASVPSPLILILGNPLSITFSDYSLSALQNISLSLFVCLFSSVQRSNINLLISLTSPGVLKSLKILNVTLTWSSYQVLWSLRSISLFSTVSLYLLPSAHAHFHSGISNSPSLHSINCSFLCRQGLQCISLNSLDAFVSFTIFRRKPDKVFGIACRVLGNKKEGQARGSAFHPSGYQMKQLNLLPCPGTHTRDAEAGPKQHQPTTAPEENASSRKMHLALYKSWRRASWNSPVLGRGESLAGEVKPTDGKQWGKRK